MSILLNFFLFAFGVILVEIEKNFHFASVFLLAFASICTLANLDSAIAEICVTARRVTSGLPGAMEELLLSAAKFNCSCAFPSISASLSTALSL